jgi:GAF domain-containing protein
MPQGHFSDLVSADELRAVAAMDLPPRMERELARVNRLLDTQRTMPAKLEALAEVIERTFRNCDSVSIALVVEEQAVTAAASSALAIEADLVQYGYNQGPCLLSVRRRSAVRIDVLGEDERFEHFAPGAIEQGVESVLSVPLWWAGSVVGSINLYSGTRCAFDDGTIDQLRPLCEYAASVIARSPLYAATLDLIDGLAEAITESADVEMGVGVLRETDQLSAEAAFDHLRSLALGSGLSMAEVAREVIAIRREIAGLTFDRNEGSDGPA